MNDYGYLHKIKLDDFSYIDEFEKRKKVHKHLLLKRIVVMCLCLILLGLYTIPYFSVDHSLKIADSFSICNNIPGGIRPELQINDTVYYWSRMGVELYGTEKPYGSVAMSSSFTYLPEGYEEYGELLSIGKKKITKDCQMSSGFEASGTIYISKLTPEAVYVFMTTSWFENCYVRFISKVLDRECVIHWNGSKYTIAIGRREICGVVEQLPQGCKPIGGLHFIGEDAIPENDLETNCPSDTYSYALEEREVFYDSKDPNYIYVFEPQYWAKGTYNAYVKCPIEIK